MLSFKWAPTALRLLLNTQGNRQLIDDQGTSGSFLAANAVFRGALVEQDGFGEPYWVIHSGRPIDAASEPESLVSTLRVGATKVEVNLLVCHGKASHT